MKKKTVIPAVENEALLHICAHPIGATPDPAPRPAENNRPGIIERAFQVAKSGAAGNIHDVRTQLAREGYSNANTALTGRSLALQITRIIAEARAAPNRPQAPPAR